MMTITCAWKTNDDVTRERAQLHRTDTIRLQIANPEGSIICTLKDDRCEYEIDCSEAWCGRNIHHLLDCDRLTIEVA